LTQRRWVVEVGFRPGLTDSPGANTKREIEDTGFKGVEEVRSLRTYILEGEVDEKGVARLCDELLADPVSDWFVYDGSWERMGDVLMGLGYGSFKGWAARVALLPGVTDATGESVRRTAAVLGVNGLEAARTAATYLLRGELAREAVEALCWRVLANPIIQSWEYRLVEAG